MKIALVNNLYYPYNRGGAETVVEKMIADLRAQNNEVILFTLRPKKEAASENVEISDEDGLKIYRFASDYSRLAEFSLFRKILWHGGDIFSFKKTAAIKKILAAEKPEMVITHNLMGIGFRLPQAIKKLNIRHEHYLHDIQLIYPSGLMMFGKEGVVDSLGAKIYQHLTRRFFNSPAKIISPSAWLLKEHKKRGFFKHSNEEIKRFNVIKEKEKEPLNGGRTIARQKKHFLFVGQIEAHKGIMFLIQTFKKARQIKSDIFLTVAGDGELLNEAKITAGENEHIEFRGRLNSPEIKTLMEASDCLIVPSLCYENSPTTIYEAQAIGLPVIAANIGGIPEIVGPKDKLFEPSNSDDLIKNILED